MSGTPPTKLLDVPVIDIAPFLQGGVADRAAVAERVGRACRDIGFLVIQGHGVSPALRRRMGEISRAFFDLPLAEKMRVARPARTWRAATSASTRNRWRARATRPPTAAT